MLWGIITDSEGNFVIRSLPAGAYTLVVGTGQSAVTKTVMVPSEPKIVEIVFSPGGH